MSYLAAIDAIGEASKGRGIYEGPGISIKLSALHPRYSRAQYQRVIDELYPRLYQLALQAKQYNIGLNVDAEEADRLEISLDLLEKLCFEPKLADWNGIGFVIQAYQKRCPKVIDYMVDLARRSKHRLMIRLVKGAYWDSEIKRAQLDGQEGYPVYTRKVYTDIAYLACAKKLLAAADEIYPQFATHNAHTLSAIYQLAGNNYHAGQYEFQCLHGMGEPLYDQVVGSKAEGKYERPCRIYAPVGSHETLLAYLVRRLLENGANTSFVNRVADPSISIEDLVIDPVKSAELLAQKEGKYGLPHPHIPLPKSLYGDVRANSAGLDLSNEQTLHALSSALYADAAEPIFARPLLGGPIEGGNIKEIFNPAANEDKVGEVIQVTDADLETALACAEAAAPGWAQTPGIERAAILERAADRMEADIQPLMNILVREAGKTFANGISEVREAVDFLRYYAAQVRSNFNDQSFVPLGPVVCISPWNFPLAIFTGQIAAALAAGNSVLAKPAEQTSLVAWRATKILHDAGVPVGSLQLLTGKGSIVGPKVVGDDRVKGVMFTGSTEVARSLQGNMGGRLDNAGRPVPLIAETGGLNAMIVDSSALAEQVVADIISSAFDSAGQRCSALRLLYVQEDCADRVITMLKGAMRQYRLGRTDKLSADTGPVIDARAMRGIEKHIEEMKQKGKAVFRASIKHALEISNGTYVEPTLIELDSGAELDKEIFGPVLHVVRYQRSALNNVIEEINRSGFGLTLGIHTRIDETVDKVISQAKVGNIYVNRNIVGAVVGVQPFGGEGLSGTGPKAGGPIYIYRLLSARTDDAVNRSLRDQRTVSSAEEQHFAELEKLREWTHSAGHLRVANLCNYFRGISPAGRSIKLTGPTGESNSYHTHSRDSVLCLSSSENDLLVQTSAAFAVGSTPVWPASSVASGLLAAMPQALKNRIVCCDDWHNPKVSFDAVLFHGVKSTLKQVIEEVVKREGAIIAVHGYSSGETDIALERLVLERAVSINTAAAGGNTSLMTLS